MKRIRGSDKLNVYGETGAGLLSTPLLLIVLASLINLL